MIQIKPKLEYSSHCSYCKSLLKKDEIVWQGIHVCIKTICSNCDTIFLEDLPVGHALVSPYKIDLSNKILLGNDDRKGWFGEPLFNSFYNPQKKNISLTITKYKSAQSVIILNCIDFIYGHSLLKLLNAQYYLEKHKHLGLVVIVPKSLTWMVPRNVAEIWTIDIPFHKAQQYYPDLNNQITKECKRFQQIHLSKAYCHPYDFDITQFTNIQKHTFREENFRITFVWREDRLWYSNSFLLRLLQKIKLFSVYQKIKRSRGASLLSKTTMLHQWPIFWQNLKIRRLFSLLKKRVPNATFTVVGFGTTTKFPSWIEDYRVDSFSDNQEKKACTIYSQSRIILGVHGSNMLLPSAHAGITIDLMPDNRWGNVAQDIIYQEKINNVDARIISFLYHYLPIDIATYSLTVMIHTLLKLPMVNWLKQQTNHAHKAPLTQRSHHERSVRLPGI